MSWDKVGQFLKQNAGKGVGLVGSLVSGNLPAAVAMGVSMVAEATGSDDPTVALASLQSDPGTIVRLKEIALARQAEINRHIEQTQRQVLEDRQHEHSETQLTIRHGDSSEDPYVRRARPQMAKGSLVASFSYVLICLILDSPVQEWVLVTLIGPCVTWMGMRTWDKVGVAKALSLGQSGLGN